MENKAEKITLVDPTSLKLNPRNANRHSKEQIKRLAAIIAYSGFREPITISNQTGVVIAGEGRVLASIALGLKKIPAIYQDFDDEDQETAYGISTNAIASWSDLDLSFINSELIPELGPDFDIELLGIKGFEIEVADKNTNDPDAIPEKVEPKSKLGDLYILGEHRLLCGDSTNIQHVERLMNGVIADLVFTDPPYRMAVEGGSDQPIGRAAAKLGEAIKHLCDFDPVAFLNTLAASFKKNTMNAYVFCNKDLLPDYLNWAIKAGYNFNLLFWKKPNAIPLGGNHRPDVEYLLLFRRSAIWNNSVEGVNYSKCLEFGRELSKDHPTIKPVELITNELKISSNVGSPVLDLFGGSGSTLIACEKTNRKCFMMELDPNYCDVIISRFEKYSGKKAVLESN